MAKTTSLVFSFLLAFFWILSCATEKPAVSQQAAGKQSAAVSSGEEPELPASAAAETSASQSSAYEYEKALILDGASSYRVIWGDTLSKLAVRYYGRENGYYFPLIMLASPGAVNNPDKIIPGRILTVPDLRRNLDNPDSRRMLKEYIIAVSNIYAAKAPTKWSGHTRNQLRALASTL